MVRKGLEAGAAVVAGVGLMVLTLLEVTPQRAQLDSEIADRLMEIGREAGKLPPIEAADARAVIRTLTLQRRFALTTVDADDPIHCSETGMENRGLLRHACADLGRERSADQIYRARAMNDTRLESLRATKGPQDLLEGLGLAGGVVFIGGGAFGFTRRNSKS